MTKAELALVKALFHLSLECRAMKHRMNDDDSGKAEVDEIVHEIGRRKCQSCSRRARHIGYFPLMKRASVRWWTARRLNAPTKDASSVLARLLGGADAVDPELLHS